MLPELRRASRQMRELSNMAIFAHEQIHDMLNVYGSRVRELSHPNHEEFANFRAEEEQARLALGRQIFKLEATGVMVKDARAGLFDFYALRDFQLVQLCWQVGESTVAYWHSPEGGFARRQPIIAEDFLGE